MVTAVRAEALSALLPVRVALLSSLTKSFSPDLPRGV
jgi:hypothetical protein